MLSITLKSIWNSRISAKMKAMKTLILLLELLPALFLHGCSKYGGKPDEVSLQADSLPEVEMSDEYGAFVTEANSILNRLG